MPASALTTRLSDADIAGSFVARQLRIGLEYYAAGGIDAAIAAYRRGLVEPPGCVSIATISELHSNLGNACMVRGDFEQAASNYKAALRLKPDLVSCWCNLGNTHLKAGNPRDSITLYLHALTLNPGHWPSCSNLVHALMATQQYPGARALLMELVEERPQDGQLHHQLGKVCFELNELPSALAGFRRAVSLNPRDADSLYWIGGVQQMMGDLDAARAAYTQAARMQPLIRRPAAKSPAEFRVLALYAPFAGNTPTEYLFKDAVYDTDTFALVDAGEVDIELLKKGAHVVVNLISDADQAEAVLPLAAELAGRLGKPTVNDPLKIQRTARDTVADLLAGIPGCHIPKVLRQKAGAELSVAALCAAFPSVSAILARPVGTHGGDDFEKIDHPAGLAVLLAQRPEPTAT